MAGEGGFRIFPIDILSPHLSRSSSESAKKKLQTASTLGMTIHSPPPFPSLQKKFPL